jgi:hypothetical protein
MRQSGADTLATEEPDELITHVRVCGGAGWVTTGSTRKPTANSVRSLMRFTPLLPLSHKTYAKAILHPTFEGQRN